MSLTNQPICASESLFCWHVTLTGGSCTAPQCNPSSQFTYSPWPGPLWIVMSSKAINVIRFPFIRPILPLEIIIHLICLLCSHQS